MANTVYRSWLAKCLAAGCGVSPPANVVTFYVYAVDSTFGFNTLHGQLSDLVAGSYHNKSAAVTHVLEADGSLNFPVITDLFNGAAVAGMDGLIITAEWVDGTTPKNSLVAYIQTWDQSITPVTTTEAIKLAFTNNFVFRLGSVGPVV